MKTLLVYCIVILSLVSCRNYKIKNNLPPADSISSTDIRKIKIDSVVMAKNQQSESFKPILNFPTIQDSSIFISELKKNCNLEVDESPKSKEIEKISYYKKIKLYGSTKDYILIEYNWRVGCMASYPWKYQLLFTTDGKLLKIFSAQRFDFIKIFTNQNPFLLLVIVTGKGNGGHEIYKITNDTLENIYEGYYDFAVQTYDANEDLSVFEPNELNIQIIDYNKDGFNDVVFTGKKLMLGAYTKDGIWYDVEVVNGKDIPYTVNNPAKKISVKYVFLYDKKSGHLKAKENYRNEN